MPPPGALSTDHFLRVCSSSRLWVSAPNFSHINFFPKACGISCLTFPKCFNDAELTGKVWPVLIALVFQPWAGLPLPESAICVVCSLTTDVIGAFKKIIVNASHKNKPTIWILSCRSSSLVQRVGWYYPLKVVSNCGFQSFSCIR